MKRMQSIRRDTRNAAARGTTRPLFENLEGRRLFSVAVAMAAAGTLTFTGNNAADTVNIEDSGSGVISGNVTNAAGAQTAFGPVGGVRTVVVRTGGGNDEVNYRFTGDLTNNPFGRRRINVNLG